MARTELKTMALRAPVRRPKVQTVLRKAQTVRLPPAVTVLAWASARTHTVFAAVAALVVGWLVLENVAWLAFGRAEIFGDMGLRNLARIGLVVVAGLSALAIWALESKPRLRTIVGLIGFLLVTAGLGVADSLMAWAPGAAPSGVYLACLFIVFAPIFVPRSAVALALLVLLAAALVPGSAALVAILTGQALIPTALVYIGIGAVVAAAAALFLQRGVKRYSPPAPIIEEVEEEIEVATDTFEAPTAEPTEAGSLGRYHLIKRLGVGGMGEVWHAEHEVLARPAALKLVRSNRLKAAGGGADEVLERFRQEAEVTSQLGSPHTVKLYDFGLTDDGSFYYAMELLDGKDLRGLVEAFGPVHEARLAFLMVQACHSLYEAHCAGLVHRDLKPENLYVAKVGLDHDFLKVLDFGLVKELDDAVVSEDDRIKRKQPRKRLTVAGAIPGTPAFMAPEQVQRAGVDFHADIYALGCVAYFALTGKQVFEGTVDTQIMFAHLDAEPVAPSTRIGRPVHAGLEALIMQCLEKSPAARPASMKALATSLRALHFDEPWTHDRAAAWWAERAS